MDNKNVNYNYNRQKPTRKLNDTSIIEPKTYETIVEEEIPKKYQTKLVANCSKLNVRKNPSKDSEVLSIIDAGTYVKVQEEVGEWTSVIIKPDIKGFVMSAFLKEK